MLGDGFRVSLSPGRLGYVKCTYRSGVGLTMGLAWAGVSSGLGGCLIESWGSPGGDVGETNGRMLICDPEKLRLQVARQAGRLTGGSLFPRS